jgi:hypothetical protein
MGPPSTEISAPQSGALSNRKIPARADHHTLRSTIASPRPAWDSCIIAATDGQFKLNRGWVVWQIEKLGSSGFCRRPERRRLANLSESLAAHHETVPDES